LPASLREPDVSLRRRLLPLPAQRPRRPGAGLGFAHLPLIPTHSAASPVGFSALSDTLNNFQEDLQMKRVQFWTSVFNIGQVEVGHM
jgi:hypothetical protein